VPNVTGSFEDVKDHNEALIRKMLEMSLYLAPWPAGPDITTITDATGTNLVIPDIYKSVGMTSKDEGLSLTPSIDMSEVGAYGYGAAVRRDVTNRSLETSFTMLESGRLNFEVYHGVDLSGVTYTAAKREIVYNQPDRPESRYYRGLFIGKDGAGAGSIYHAEFTPKLIVTDVEAISWSEEDPVAYGVTMSADMDSAIGTSQRTFWAGPGVTTALLEAMNFELAA
jgi:hypothetical protein